MNPRLRRTQRTRNADDIVVLKRERLDPRGVCIRCYELCAPKAVYCEKCKPHKYEIFPRTLVLAATLLTACNPFAPSTSLEVSNELPVELNVRAAPCGLPTEAFAALEPGQSRTRNVAPGCWAVEGWTADGRMGAVEVNVAEHSLHRLPFYAEG